MPKVRQTSKNVCRNMNRLDKRVSKPKVSKNAFQRSFFVPVIWTS
jgi:hypothetical protein